MKKRLLYIVALILTGVINSAFIYGQSGSMLEKLQGKTWIFQENNLGYHTKHKFTRTTKTNTFCMPGRTDVVNNCSFYLSDDFETQFNDAKVGTVENGRFMILKTQPGYVIEDDNGNIIPSTATVVAIIELNDTELKMRSFATTAILTYRASLVQP